MTGGEWVAAAVTAGVAIEIWAGAAVVLRKDSMIVPSTSAFLIRRNEFEFGYWLAVAGHSSFAILLWVLACLDKR